MRFTAQGELAANRSGQLLGRDLCAIGCPVRIGAQEDLRAALFGLLQRAQQVGGNDLAGRQLRMEVTVQIGVNAGRTLVTHVLGVQAHLGRHHRHHQLHPVGFQGLAHAFDQRVVVGHVLLGVGPRLELFIAEQPVVAAQHHAGTAFIEQGEIQRCPQVGAQPLDRELVVIVGLDGFAPATVQHGGVVGGVKAHKAAQ